jgi:hypothetical protein
MAGDLGFDPLGFSSWVNLGFVQEAEIKHCRLAMLGLAGCFVESAGLKFPGVDKVFGTSTVSKLRTACRGGSQSDVEAFSLFAERV